MDLCSWGVQTESNENIKKSQQFLWQTSSVPDQESKLLFKLVVYVDVRGAVQTSQYACRQHKYETHTQTHYTNTWDTTDITGVFKNNKIQTQNFETTLPKYFSLSLYTLSPFQPPHTKKYFSHNKM